MAEAAPTPFPEGDPRNAKYFENLAALEHGYQKSLAEGAETRANARTNAEYATGQIAKAEPEGFRNLRNRANSEGLLQSGVLAGRTGTLASSYGARRYAITHGLQEREGRISRGEQAAKERFELGRSGAATRALEEGKATALANPGARTVTGPAGPGGVVPYTEKTAGGSVRVGPGAPTAVVKARQPITGGVRSAAARRVAGRFVRGPGGERIYRAYG